MADITVNLKLDASEAEAIIDRLQAKAEALLATIEKCKGACASCVVPGVLSKRGADLVAVLREEDYRTERAS